MQNVNFVFSDDESLVGPNFCDVMRKQAEDIFYKTRDNRDKLVAKLLENLKRIIGKRKLVSFIQATLIKHYMEPLLTVTIAIRRLECHFQITLAKRNPVRICSGTLYYCYFKY